MIDLRNKRLPDAIECGGKRFSIVTDFREWLKFGELSKDARPMGEYLYLLKNKENIREVEAQELMNALMTFYVNPNITPINTGGSNRKLLDWIEDGEYIVGSYLAIYGIDLCEVDYLHWHKFQALFRSLPSDSRIMEIMGYRAYKPTKKKQEQIYQHQCDIWAFPSSSKIDTELADELANEFYGTL